MRRLFAVLLVITMSGLFVSPAKAAGDTVQEVIMDLLQGDYQVSTPVVFRTIPIYGPDYVGGDRYVDFSVVTPEGDTVVLLNNELDTAQPGVITPPYTPATEGLYLFIAIWKIDGDQATGSFPYQIGAPEPDPDPQPGPGPRPESQPAAAVPGQGLPVPASGDCRDVNEQDSLWAKDVKGGWYIAWATWRRENGDVFHDTWACVRSLEYRDGVLQAVAPDEFAVFTIADKVKSLG